MKIKVILYIAIIALALIIGIFLNVKTKDPQESFPSDVFFVGGTGPGNYSSIQHAINDAFDNATVFIYGGLYHEHLQVEKQIHLIGESQGDTILDGSYNGTTLAVSCNGVQIRNITFRKSGGQIGDALLYSTGNNIIVQDSVFEHARHGIQVSRSRGILVQNCIFYRTAIGIRAQESQDAFLADCSFIKNGIGILSTGSDNIKIHKVTGEFNGVTVMTENCEHIHVTGCRLFNGNENQVSLYAEDTKNITVDNCTIYHSGRGIIFSECSDATLRASQIFDSKIGVEISATPQLFIEKSWIYENDVGVYLESSDDVLLINNAISDNYVANLAAEKSSGNARHNWWGAPLGWITTVHTKGGLIPTFPSSKEKPPQPVEIPISPKSYASKQPRIYGFTLEKEKDTDGDGIPDWWEDTYGYSSMVMEKHTDLDPDQDGLNNFEEFLTAQWGSHPFRQDLFVEIDVMDSSYEIDEERIEDITQKFATHNITLHIDTKDIAGNSIVEKRDYINYATLIDLYWTYFLNDDPLWWRKGVFHYVLLSDSLFKDAPGFVFIGWDDADAFALSIKYYKDEIPQRFQPGVLSKVFLHELGHTLGLFHDVYPAIDNESSIIPFLVPSVKGLFIYRNYRSCMNYQYAWQILDYSDGSHGRNDFDDWGHIDLIFFQDSHWGT